MKVTMYELLGLVKDGKAPKEIKYEDDIYTYDEDKNDYVTTDFPFGLMDVMNDFDFLKKEIEIIEEKPKKIDELDYRLSYAVYYECKCEIDKVMTLIRPILENKNKINELAKAVNYLLEKSDK